MGQAGATKGEVKGTPGNPLVVGLAQINNSFSGQNYLPYSIGLLQAHTLAHAAAPARYRFLLPLYKRLRADAAVEHLRSADIVGFSLYVWNERLSLEIAKRLKQVRPDVVIVFGGPQVPDRAEAWLRANPFVDIACHGEGEQVFLNLLEALPSGDLSGVPGISFLPPDGAFHHQPKAGRTREIEATPSPYLSGTFRPLIEAHREETWIVLWETNRGCPFACTFCDWGSATQSKVFTFEMDRLKAELDWFSERKIEFIFCCDANFGILPRDIQIAEYAAANKRAKGYPKALSVQNTKNATERAYTTQKILSDAGLSKGVALALQSVDMHTLESIKRQNISLATYEELQKRFTRDNVATYSDLIIGLPGETYDAFVDGVARVIEGGQHNRIQFNNLSILPNAEMGDPAYQAKYGMVTVPTKIINVHGSLEEDIDGIAEMQQLVIATRAMPKEDWRRTRTFAWMTALLHFDKLLQIPLVVAHEVSGVGYRRLIEAFTEVDSSEYPLIASIRDFFLAEAQSIQDGGHELVYSPDYLGMHCD
ncbi:MAG: cobalamin B12-binding domain-containing protein [Proteobacteria bacterium]|nr:cobalamin B12-binding domain-containing protein [Pseudomonadota bacterium]